MEEAFATIADDTGLSSEEASAVLLVDATNGFNELGRKAMLWTVRHRWANGARFSFNCYRHSAQLLLRRRGGDCEIILSREGVTQGDPLSMVLYGLALTPLAETLRAAVPTVIQPWYADDAAMAGPVSGIAAAQRLLLELGPRRGYFPEPDKSILIAPVATPPNALEPLADFNFRHEEGHRYVGGFVGSGAAEAAWVDPQVQQWIDGVHRLASVARRYPQAAYAGLSQSLQSEWQYLQRVTPDIAPAFAPLEAGDCDCLPASPPRLSDQRRLPSSAHFLRCLHAWADWASPTLPRPESSASPPRRRARSSSRGPWSTALPSVLQSTGRTPHGVASRQKRSSAEPRRTDWKRSSMDRDQWRSAASSGRQRPGHGSPPSRAYSTALTSRPRSSEMGSAFA